MATVLYESSAWDFKGHIEAHELVNGKIRMPKNTIPEYLQLPEEQEKVRYPLFSIRPPCHGEPGMAYRSFLYQMHNRPIRTNDSTAFLQI